MLIKDTCKIVNSTGHTASSISWIIIMMVVDIAISYVLSNIDNNNDFEVYVRIYIILLVLGKIVNFVFNKKIEKYGNYIIKSLTHDYYNKYCTLSFQDKKKTSSYSFRRKLVNGMWSVIGIFTWGMTALTHLIASFISIVYVFYKKDMISTLIIIVILNIVVYVIYTRYLQFDFNKFRREAKLRRNELESYIECKLPQIENNLDPMCIIDREFIIDNDRCAIQNKWQYITLVTNISNVLPLIIFVISPPNPVSFLITNRLFMNCVSALNGVTQFFNCYQRYSTDWDDLQNIFDGKELNKEKPDSIDVAESIYIEDININLNNFNVKGDKFSVNQGDKILIRGKSGHGKSTFVNGFLGKIDGVRFDKNKPVNYYHQVVEFYQDIKEKTPSGKITVRQLFDDEQDDGKIEECLKLAKSYEWIKNLDKKKVDKGKEYNGIGKILSKSWSMIRRKDVVIDKVDEQFINNHIFDRHINNKHSGGQKSRLIIAIMIYRLRYGNPDAKILVLDEPEQGSDAETAYDMLGNILDEFSGITIIVVSHLELLAEKYDWNILLEVKDGYVAQC